MKPEVIKKLQKIIGEENVRTSTAERYVYGFDSSIHRHMADVVVRPKSTEQVAEVAKLANKYKIPVIPRGAGTALCGHSVPINGGIVIDLQGMNKVKEIRIEDLYCVVEPGVIYDELNRLLKPYRFFFPCAPGSGEVCTIGGMVAVNASGMRAIKYGATRDYVMALEVVLPTGDIMRCGTRTLKNASGYQLEKLFVGCEGTLGIITEITLKLAPLPRARAACLASFDVLEKAGNCVSALIAKPLLPSSIEIMDCICIRAVNKGFNNIFPDCQALLLVEVDGHPASVKEEIGHVEEVCRKTGATNIEITDEPKKMDAWTSGRKAVLPSLSRYGETFVSVSLADDMAVPISQIPKAVIAFQKIAEKNGVIVGTYGHASDGNLHTKLLIDPLSAEHWKRAEKAVGEIFDECVKLGGTVSGEHGSGISKAPYMIKERESALKAMFAIKKALDPNNIMNPDKMMQWNKSIIVALRYPVEVK